MGPARAGESLALNLSNPYRRATSMPVLQATDRAPSTVKLAGSSTNPRFALPSDGLTGGALLSDYYRTAKPGGKRPLTAVDTPPRTCSIRDTLRHLKRASL